MEIDINYIINEGMPKKRSMIKEILLIYKLFGIRGLFQNKKQIVISLLILGSFYLFGFCNIKSEKIPIFMFVISPILFILIQGMVSYTSKTNHMYEVEMTGVINFFKLSSARMLITSIVGMIINNFCIFLYWILGYTFCIERTVLLTNSSMFFISTMIIWLIRKKRNFYSIYILLGIWSCGNICMQENFIYLHFIYSVSEYLHVGVLIGGIAAYAYQFYKIFYSK